MKATYVKFACMECRWDGIMSMEDAFERMKANDMMPAPDWWADAEDACLLTLCHSCLPRGWAKIQTRTSCVYQHPGWADMQRVWVERDGVSLTSIEHFRPQVRVVDTGHGCTLRSADETEWPSRPR